MYLLLLVEKFRSVKIGLLNQTFLAMHKDELPWEEIGVVTLADEAISTTCYRLVNTDQCFLPSALQSVIKKIIT